MGPQIATIKQSGKPGQAMFEMMANLALQFGFLGDQVAAMAAENLKFTVHRTDFFLD